MSELKTFVLSATGNATFECSVQAGSMDEARQKFENGDYETEQVESWVEEVDSLDTIEEIKQ